MAVSHSYRLLWTTGVTVLVLGVAAGLLSDYKICGDPECESLMSRVQAVRDHRGKDCRFLSFRRGDTIFVYHKLTGRRDDLWAGSIDKQFGYFPKDVVREVQVYATLEKVVETQRSDFFCVDEFGYLVDATNLDGDDENEDHAIQIQESGINQINRATEDTDGQNPSSLGHPSTKTHGTREKDGAVNHNPVESNEQGGLPSSSWFSSPVTGLFSAGRGEESVISTEEERDDDQKETKTLTSSVTGWLGFGGGDEAKEVAKSEAENAASLTSTMSGWLGFGGETKADSAKTEQDVNGEIVIGNEEVKFNSRRMSLDIEGSQLYEEDKEETQTLTWLGNRLSSTLGFGKTSGHETVPETEAGDIIKEQEEQPASGSWFGIDNILGFRKDKSDVDFQDNPLEQETPHTEDSEISQAQRDKTELDGPTLEKRPEKDSFEELGDKTEAEPAVLTRVDLDTSEGNGAESEDDVKYISPQLRLEGKSQADGGRSDEDGSAETRDEENQHKSVENNSVVSEKDDVINKTADVTSLGLNSESDSGEVEKDVESHLQSMATKSEEEQVSEIMPVEIAASGDDHDDNESSEETDILPETERRYGDSGEDRDFQNAVNGLNNSVSFHSAEIDQEKTNENDSEKEMGMEDHGESMKVEETQGRMEDLTQEVEESGEKGKIPEAVELNEEEKIEEMEERNKSVVSQGEIEQAVVEQLREKEEIEDQEEGDKLEDVEQTKQEELENRGEMEVKEERQPHQDGIIQKKEKTPEIDEFKESEKEKSVELKQTNQENVEERSATEKLREVTETHEEGKQRGDHREEMEETREKRKQQQDAEVLKEEEKPKEMDDFAEAESDGEANEEAANEFIEKEKLEELREMGKEGRQEEVMELKGEEESKEVEALSRGMEIQKEIQENDRQGESEEPMNEEEKQEIFEEAENDGVSGEKIEGEATLVEVEKQEKREALENEEQEEIQDYIIYEKTEELNENIKEEENAETGRVGGEEREDEEERVEALNGETKDEEEKEDNEDGEELNGIKEEIKQDDMDEEEKGDEGENEEKMQDEKKLNEDQQKEMEGLEVDGNGDTKQEEEEGGLNEDINQRHMGENKERESSKELGGEVEMNNMQKAKEEDAMELEEKHLGEINEEKTQERLKDDEKQKETMKLYEIENERKEEVVRLKEDERLRGMKQILGKDEEVEVKQQEKLEEEKAEESKLKTGLEEEEFKVEEIENVNTSDDVSSSEDKYKISQLNENVKAEFVHTSNSGETDLPHEILHGNTSETGQESSRGSVKPENKHYNHKTDVDETLNESPASQMKDSSESPSVISEHESEGSAGSSRLSDDGDRKEAESQTYGGALGLFKNVFGFYTRAPVVETNKLADSDLSLDETSEPEPSQISEEETNSDNDSDQDTTLTVSTDEPQHFPSTPENFQTSTMSHSLPSQHTDIPLQTKTLHESYKNLPAHISMDEVATLLELFGEYELRFLDVMLGSSETVTEDESMLSDMEKRLHYHFETLTAPSMRTEDASQEEKETTRTLVALRKLEVLITRVRETYGTKISDTRGADPAETRCVGESCSPHSQDQEMSPEEHSRETDDPSEAKDDEVRRDERMIVEEGGESDRGEGGTAREWNDITCEEESAHLGPNSLNHSGTARPTEGRGDVTAQLTVLSRQHVVQAPSADLFL